jgi:hypothetical protein
MPRQAGSCLSSQTLGISKVTRSLGIAGIRLRCLLVRRRVLGLAVPHLEGLAARRPSGPAFSTRWPTVLLGVRGAVVARLLLGVPVVACPGLARYSVLMQLLCGLALWLLPNPSINRTANGGSPLLAFAYAQPPLSAGYLKR